MKLPRVQEICDKIVLLDGKDPDEMARLKQQLPVVYFHAQGFKSDLRSSANATPSGLVMLDVDHVESPQDFAKALLEKEGDGLAFLEKNRIALVAKTPSNHGLRIVGEMQEGETIMQAQKRIADLFGIKQYDAVTKDLARASFVMPWSYVFYFDEKLLQFPDQPTAQKWGNTIVDAQPNSPASLVEEGGGKGAGGGLGTQPQRDKGDTQPTSPANQDEEDRTRKIALQLLELLGGQPTQGERNNIYYNLCRHLRTICAFSPDWLCVSSPTSACRWKSVAPPPPPPSTPPAPPTRPRC